MKDLLTNHSGVLALIGLSIVSAILWVLNGTYPIFVFGGVAVVWLLWLMLKGIFTPGFKPAGEEAQHPNAVRK